MTPEEVLQEVQFLDKYSRLSPTGERETWQQSVDRTVSFLRELSGNRLSEKEYDFIRRMILEKKAMPSMRLLAMAGEAARRTNVSLFNCSYMPIDDPVAFKEAVLILMSGTGLGYSVERKYTDRLPGVINQTGATDSYRVPDTTEGGPRLFTGAL
jgi:ribonucleoside-triphosphate reductase (thioredoxin)